MFIEPRQSWLLKFQVIVPHTNQLQLCWFNRVLVTRDRPLRLKLIEECFIVLKCVLIPGGSTKRKAGMSVLSDPACVSTILFDLWYHPCCSGYIAHVCTYLDYLLDNARLNTISLGRLDGQIQMAQIQPFFCMFSATSEIECSTDTTTLADSESFNADRKLRLRANRSYKKQSAS